MKRVSGKARCAICGAELHGIPRKRRLAKSKRSIRRPWGGYLCSRCSRKALKERIKYELYQKT
jgi:large subunit ribosomal protein L34e